MFNNSRYGWLILGLIFPLVSQANGSVITSGVDGTPYTRSLTATPVPSLLRVSVLGSATVTNTGLTIVNGDVDVAPGSAITGFPPGKVVNGSLHAGDIIASSAHANAQTYYNEVLALPCPPSHNLTGQDLGGKTLAPGVYCFSSSAQLTGTLTLQGNSTSSYVFQIGSTLTTASDSKVVLTGGVKNSNVTWAIGSSATLGTGTDFQGIIDAVASITITTGVNLVGRAWALNGAVTMDSNVIIPTIPEDDMCLISRK